MAKELQVALEMRVNPNFDFLMETVLSKHQLFVPYCWVLLRKQEMGDGVCSYFEESSSKTQGK